MLINSSLWLKKIRKENLPVIHPIDRTRSRNSWHHSMGRHRPRHWMTGSMTKRRSGRQAETSRARSTKGLMTRRGKMRISTSGWAAHEGWPGRPRPSDELRSSRRRSERSMSRTIERRSAGVRRRSGKSRIRLRRSGRWRTRRCRRCSVLGRARSRRRAPIRRPSCRGTCPTRRALERRRPLEARRRPGKVLPRIRGKILRFRAGRWSLPGGGRVLQRGWQRDGRGYAPGTASWK